MLKKIVVKNFMCHDNFEITLNPRVNFITGQNGSGKSAIVAALMLGFGQRATVTNRGQSVKDFIKRGRHSAVLEITLTNNADFAYEYEEFGDEITVVRKITESSSTYSIKDSQGKSHPCNARTLNGLLLHFSIQPNNPLCILSQDVARTFLQKFDPRSLFSLYSQATLSKTINDSFAESKDALRKLTLKIASRKEDIENLKKEVEDAERRKQMAEKYKLLMESEELVKNELIWSKVKALEDSVKKKEQIQLEIDSERNNILHKIKNCSEDALKEKLVKLEGDLGRCQENLSKLEIEQSKENDGLDRVKEELSILKQHFKEVDQLIQRKDREIEQLQEASNKVLNVNVPEIQKQKNELQSVVAKIHELEAVRKTTEVHLNQLRDTFENNAPANERISSDIRRVTNKITESRGKMELFKKGKSLALYGEWMPHFVEELSKATNRGRFTKMPKGPIGSFLQVVDPDWAPAIENVLKGHVSTFCLNSDADLKEFLRIAEKCVPRNSIPPSSTSTFLPQVHDYSQHEVQHPRYSSFIRQLKCSDADVLNCLIDELGIEQILLVPELDSTYQLCEETHNVPKNLKYCITKEGDRVHPSPSYKFFAGRMKTKVATYLQVNPTQHLTYLERKITESQQELASLKHERITIEQSTQAVKNDIAETQKSLDSLRRQLKHLNDKKLDFESKIDIEPVSVDLYKRDMEMSVYEKEKAVQKKEEIISKIGRAEVKIEEVFKNLKIISETLRPITEEKTKILQLIDSTEKDLRDKERLGTKLRAQFHSLAEKEKSLKDEMQRIRNSMKEMTENAQQTAIKIETIRDLQVVEENLRTIKAELLGLKNFCEEDTIEIAEQEYLEKKQRLKKCTRVMARVERDAKESSKKLARDTKAIEISEQKDLLKAKALFSEVLKKRDLQGSFSLDKNNQILKMNVVRGKEKGTGKKGELSSLSGGEKSFATIAFIIAMWESMTVPFFVMDEFDVFTDVITRNTILKMLLEYASQNAAQFIFLTPHDLSRIDTNRDDVTVHSIKSPRS